MYIFLIEGSFCDRIMWVCSKVAVGGNTMNMMLKNGTLIDPERKTMCIGDLYIMDGYIVDKDTFSQEETDEVIDGSNQWIMPGFVDLHVHLREPGFEYKETIETGANAAARGGYTTILAMPNTNPVADCVEVINYVYKKAETASVRVLQIGAVTKGQLGIELADLAQMIQAGIPAISEDGKSVANAGLYRDAMEIVAKQDIPVFAHCEDQNLVNGGVANADESTCNKGLKGITNSVEDVIIARDIILAKETGARLHLCHCSTQDSVEMIKRAKAEGLSITGEVCPHHFSLCSSEIDKENSNFKMNPPLRTRKDVQALIQGLSTDIMDVIATDHAPHSEEEKNQNFNQAPFGIVGLETAASLTYTYLVKPGYLTPLQMAEKMSLNPARIIRQKTGGLSTGNKADIVIFDPHRSYLIDPKEFKSKGRNTPFAGKNVFGIVTTTIYNGRVVYQEDRK